MVRTYALPLIYNRESLAVVEEDLSLALLFWSLESEREKGGGLLRRKDAEYITQVSLIRRPILVANYGVSSVAIDCCGLLSTHLKYSITPSFTRLPSFVRSDRWDTKPDSYSNGLSQFSEEFERVLQAYEYELPGWIDDSSLLKEVTDVLKFSTETEVMPNDIQISIDSGKVASSLQELDKLKHLVQSEINPLKEIEHELNEKTSEVLKPLTQECSRIQERYDREIDKIRPSIAERKLKYERETLAHHRQIETRFSGRLHDLRNKRDAAQAKIDAYDPYSGRRPKGGIDRQYSLRDSTKKRIKELEEEQASQIDEIDERYDDLIREEQMRIDSLEEQKKAALSEPRRKISGVSSATNDVSKAIDNLIESHTSLINFGIESTVIPPQHISFSEFIVYLPIIVATIVNDRGSRIKFVTPTALKEGKRRFGTLKGIMGVKFAPLEDVNDHLMRFTASMAGNQRIMEAIKFIASNHDLLRDTRTKTLLGSGITKMQERGWVTAKEATEFQESINKHFVPTIGGLVSQKISEQQQDVSEPKAPTLVQFVTYNGIARKVEINDLATYRKEDRQKFDIASPQKPRRKSDLLIDFLKELTIPHTKQYCVDQKEDFVQNMLYMQLANSDFRSDLHREKSFRIENSLASRIDFDVGGIGVEVKIFRSKQDFERLTGEMLRYGERYMEIVIPYINAGGYLSNEDLEASLKLLSKHYPQVKDYFPIKCKEATE